MFHFGKLFRLFRKEEQPIANSAVITAASGSMGEGLTAKTEPEATAIESISRLDSDRPVSQERGPLHEVQKTPGRRPQFRTRAGNFLSAKIVRPEARVVGSKCVVGYLLRRSEHRTPFFRPLDSVR